MDKSMDSSGEINGNKRIKRKSAMIVSSSDGSGDEEVEQHGSSTSPSPDIIILNPPKNRRRREKTFSDEDEVKSPKKSTHKDATLCRNSSPIVDLEQKDDESSRESGVSLIPLPEEQESEDSESPSGSISSDYSNQDTSNDDDSCSELEIYTPPDPYFMHLKNNSSKKRPKSKKNRRQDKGCRKRTSSKSTTENSFSEDNAQEVSIFKINISKFHDSKNVTVDQIIDKIVGDYNDSQDNKYNEQKIETYPTVKEFDRDEFTGEEFKIRVYVQECSQIISLLNSFGIKCYSTSVSSLVFYFRIENEEIFVLTTNQAWHVVQRWSDFEFPAQIAARILSEKGQVESTKKGIVGNNLVNKKTHKQEQEENPFDLLEFCMSFTAEIRDNASILRLSCFQRHPKNTADQNADDSDNCENVLDDDCRKINKKSDDIVKTKELLINNAIKGVKINVALASIRIRKRLSTADFLSILDLLSTINRGEKTINLNEDAEKDSTAHLKFLTTVHTEVAKKLDASLAKVIHDAVADPQKESLLDGYEFVHKFYKDFFNGHQFTLHYGKKVIKRWQDRSPTCRQVVKALRSVSELSEFSGKEELFLKRLLNVKMSYLVRDRINGMKPEKIILYFDGISSFDNDQNIYLHVQGHWCQVREAYLQLVHQKFKNILKDNLIVDSCHNAFLQLTWPTPSENSCDEQTDAGTDQLDSVEMYLAKHKSNKNFFVPSPLKDQTSRTFFDMMKICEDTFILYFIVEALDHRTVRVNLSIPNSLTRIKKAAMSSSNKSPGHIDIGGIEIIQKQLKEVHSQLIQKESQKDLSFDTFVDKLSKAEVCLVIGSTVGNRSLKQESDVSSVLTPELIKAKLSDARKIGTQGEGKRSLALLAKGFKVSLNDDYELLAQTLYETLKGQGFLNHTGQITGKLLCQKSHSFLLQCTNLCIESKRFIFETILRPVQQQSSTFLANLALIRIHGELQKLGYKGFHILETVKE